MREGGSPEGHKGTLWVEGRDPRFDRGGGPMGAPSWLPRGDGCAPRTVTLRESLWVSAGRSRKGDARQTPRVAQDNPPYPLPRITAQSAGRRCPGAWAGGVARGQGKGYQLVLAARGPMKLWSSRWPATRRWSFHVTCSRSGTSGMVALAPQRRLARNGTGGVNCRVSRAPRNWPQLPGGDVTRRPRSEKTLQQDLRPYRTNGPGKRPLRF